jgi:23S rRNA pseudouridine2605 synthase
MVFKRPVSGGNNRSGNVSKAGNAPKRSSSPRGKSSSGSDKTDSSKTSGQYDGKRSTARKSFSSPGDKPFKGRKFDADKTPGAFGGDRKPFPAGKKPFAGKSRISDGDERPGKRFDSNERPVKRFGGDERPKKHFESDSAARKPFVSRGKSSAGSFNGDVKPGRSGGGFAADKREKFGDKKFAGRPSSNPGFKKGAGSRPFDTEKPQRSKFTENRTADAPAKTLRGRKKAAEKEESGLIRLNRYISNAGICSRRKADELIIAGVIAVNGEVVSELGYKVDPRKDQIRYNGETLKREKMVYVLLNKPKDYITTTEDPQERRTVMHLVEKASKERIYPIGRLDRNTTGLLLMTNDGDLADKLSHPRNNIVKLYQVELSKNLTQGDLNKIGFGVELEDGFIKPDTISYVAGGTKREIGIQIHSGKNRIVRRIFEHLGYEVVKLDRVVYANLTKKDLPRGRWRYLDESEIIQLKHLI